MDRRTLLVAAGAGGILVAGLAGWWLLTPRRLGLIEPRLVVTSGEVTVDARHAAAPQVVPTGATLRTGRFGSACFSVHASRVCMGASSQVRLASLDAHAADLEAGAGTLIVSASDTAVRVTLPDGTVHADKGLVAVEASVGDVVVRVLEGSARIEGPGRAPADLAAPAALALRDGTRRSASSELENEERDVTQVASGWQGSAGATLQVAGAMSRVSLDGHDVGRSPVAVLLAEGDHTLVVRGAAREPTTETLHLKAGQNVTR